MTALSGEIAALSREIAALSREIPRFLGIPRKRKFLKKKRGTCIRHFNGQVPKGAYNYHGLQKPDINSHRTQTGLYWILHIFADLPGEANYCCMIRRAPITCLYYSYHA